MRIDAQEQFSASNSYRQALGGARRLKVEAPITGFAESRTTLTPAAAHVFATREPTFRFAKEMFDSLIDKSYCLRR